MRSAETRRHRERLRRGEGNGGQGGVDACRQRSRPMREANARVRRSRHSDGRVAIIPGSARWRNRAKVTGKNCTGNRFPPLPFQLAKCRGRWMDVGEGGVGAVRDDIVVLVVELPAGAQVGDCPGFIRHERRAAGNGADIASRETCESAILRRWRANTLRLRGYLKLRVYVAGNADNDDTTAAGKTGVVHVVPAATAAAEPVDAVLGVILGLAGIWIDDDRPPIGDGVVGGSVAAATESAGAWIVVVSAAATAAGVVGRDAGYGRSEAVATIS